MSRPFSAYAIGAVVGCIVTSAILIPLALYEARQKFEFGTHQGWINGAADVTRALIDEFGECPKDVPYRSVMGVKASSIVVIEERGVKTVRVVL